MDVKHPIEGDRTHKKWVSKITKSIFHFFLLDTEAYLLIAGIKFRKFGNRISETSYHVDEGYFAK